MDHTFTVCPHCDSLNKLNSSEALTKTPICGKCGKNISLHGLVSEVNTKNFQRIIAKSDVPVIVDFWASWCGPCKMYGPEYEKASKENLNTVFLKINTEAEQQLSAQMGIRGIPCTVVFKNGKEVKRQPGAMTSNQVGNLIRSV
jgi:thioredoxin 2